VTPTTKKLITSPDPKPARVYILSLHEEHGAEDVRATLDPSKLADMAKASPYSANDEELKAIADIVAEGKVHARSGGPVSNGWGGIQLHVVDLQ
jgi:hypothetical protein